MHLVPPISALPAEMQGRIDLIPAPMPQAVIELLALAFEGRGSM
jgi:hypothetical protein